MRIGRLTIVGVMMLASGTASAHPPIQGGHVTTGSCSSCGSWRSLRPIDPGRGDLNPLATGSRLVPVDLRADWDFATLYRVGSGTAGPTVLGQNWFARRHAGVTAVFPRSVYAPAGPDFQVPVIPPDTTFVIGEANRFTAERIGLLHRAVGPAADSSGGLRLETGLPLREDLSAHVEAWHTDHATRDESRDQGDVRRGVAALLRLAGEGERWGRGGRPARAGRRDR